MSTQQLRPLPPHNPFLCSKLDARLNVTSITSSLKLYSTPIITNAITLDELPPNAVRRKRDPQWRGGFSLGVDLGMARTGVALSKGFSIRPLTVLELRGQKLEVQLLKIAEQEEADEFIVGLPKSSDGKETPQSNKVRSVAGRLAVRAAERGWRVYLQDEHGTTTEAMDRMINMGLSKSSQQRKLDAYAAMMVLERYFRMTGQGIELVLPKNLDLQEKLQKGPPEDIDFLDDFKS
ncbi:putative holliday junction resolvase [Senna tora]|uniref:Putative holliday junction resolvase n=1 Tax=Senna tora TaxID=362788 RepID=A0A835CKL9_9FABA|nr:putative holliday junction resolvase [Senna tora]